MSGFSKMMREIRDAEFNVNRKVVYGSETAHFPLPQHSNSKNNTTYSSLIISPYNDGRTNHENLELLKQIRAMF